MISCRTGVVGNSRQQQYSKVNLRPGPSVGHRVQYRRYCFPPSLWLQWTRGDLVASLISFKTFPSKDRSACLEWHRLMSLWTFCVKLACHVDSHFLLVTLCIIFLESATTVIILLLISGDLWCNISQRQTCIKSHGPLKSPKGPIFEPQGGLQGITKRRLRLVYLWSSLADQWSCQKWPCLELTLRGLRPGGSKYDLYTQFPWVFIMSRGCIHSSYVFGIVFMNV